jgi:Na+-translocating ferredoxin:NAD+ oxidoreductase subunit G
MRRVVLNGHVLTLLLLLAFVIAAGAGSSAFLADDMLQARQQFDRQNLFRILAPDSFNNDLILDSFVLSPESGAAGLINLELLGLRRDRLAYIARNDSEVVAIILPLTVDDGFNSHLDLLLGVDMMGRIEAARVLAPAGTANLYGEVEIVDSRWMAEFTGSGMRELRRPSWKPIKHDDGFDQFVGASITPKAVARGMYDALVFFQSNRIVLMQGNRQH